MMIAIDQLGLEELLTTVPFGELLTIPVSRKEGHYHYQPTDEVVTDHVTGRVTSYRELGSSYALILTETVVTQPVYGLVIDEDLTYHTPMKELLEQSRIVLEDYQWLVTINMVYDIDEIPWHQDYVWLSGADLRRILSEQEGIWIWAVLSAFPPTVSLEDVLSEKRPNPESPNLWRLPLSFLHPLAVHEFIAWDGCLSLVKSLEQQPIQRLATLYPQADDWQSYNQDFEKRFPLIEDLEDHVASYDL